MNTILFLIGLVFLSVVKHRYFWKVPGSRRFSDSTPFLISHRGYKKDNPENTMGAFIDAENKEFNWIELDVISTKDGKVVCSHNFDLERETDGRGYIPNLPLSALTSINAGVNNLNTPNSRIPVLVDVFKNLSNSTKVNIEVKAPKILDLSTARALGKIIINLPIDRIIVSSFNPFVILYFKLFHRNIITGFLYQNIEYFWIVNWLHPSYIHPRADLIDDDVITIAERKNMGINVWTINNKPSFSWCKENKIDGIITDRRPE